MLRLTFTDPLMRLAKALRKRMNCSTLSTCCCSGCTLVSLVITALMRLGLSKYWCRLGTATRGTCLRLKPSIIRLRSLIGLALSASRAETSATFSSASASVTIAEASPSSSTFTSSKASTLLSRSKLIASSSACKSRLRTDQLPSSFWCTS